MKILYALSFFVPLFFISPLYAGKWVWEQGTRQSNIERQYIIDKERTYHTNLRERKCPGNQPFKLTREITEYPDGQMYDKGYGSCLEMPTAYQTNVGPDVPRIPNPSGTWHYPRKRFMGNWYANNTGPHKKVLKYWVHH